MTEDNHFSFLLVCYAIDNGQILHRYSAKTVKEIQDMVKLLKGQGDIIIQNLDHWVLVP